MSVTFASEQGRLQFAVENLETHLDSIGDNPAIAKQGVLRALGASHVFTSAGSDAFLEALQTLIHAIPAAIRFCLETVPVTACRTWAGRQFAQYDLEDAFTSAAKASKLALYTFIGPCAILWNPRSGIALHRSLGLRMQSLSQNTRGSLAHYWKDIQKHAKEHRQEIKATALVLGGLGALTVIGFVFYNKEWASARNKELAAARPSDLIPHILRNQCRPEEENICLWENQPLTNVTSATFLGSSWKVATWLPRSYWSWVQHHVQQNGGAWGEIKHATPTVLKLSAVGIWYCLELAKRNPTDSLSQTRKIRWPLVEEWTQWSLTRKMQLVTFTVIGIGLRKLVKDAIVIQ